MIHIDQANINISPDKTERQPNNDNVFITKQITPSKLSLENSLASNMNKEKPKITLNVRLPKSKLEALKHIAAIIQTRDPNTNAMVTTEKKFKIGYISNEVNKSLTGRFDKAMSRMIFLQSIKKSAGESADKRLSRSIDKHYENAEKSTKDTSNKNSLSFTANNANNLIKSINVDYRPGLSELNESREFNSVSKSTVDCIQIFNS